MTLMGFSLTCGILSTLFLFTYSQDVAIAGSKSMRWYISSYSGNERSGRVERFPISFDARDKEQHALVGSIYGFVVVELILAMWAVGICLVNDQQQFLTEEEQVNILVEIRFFHLPSSCAVCLTAKLNSSRLPF